MQTAVIVKSVKQAKDIVDLADAIIMPIKDYSINYEYTFSILEVKEVLKMKPVFVVANKNIHNDEIAGLKTLLKEIDDIGVSGIIFYDIAFINLKRKLNLHVPLVWAQEHLTTNYHTINYWYDKGAQYAYLSSELTKDEMDDILVKSKAKLFVNVFGYLPMFTSRRHLVDNYIDYFSLDKTSGFKKIYKEDKYYPIRDTFNGTTVYSDYVLNALDEDFSDYDYIVFNSNFINDEMFYDTLLNFKKGKKEYLFPFNHGFLYKETIYKVKNNA